MGKKFRLPYSPTDRGLISYSLEQSDPPVGVVVGLHSEMTACGQAGEVVAIKMTQLGIPARIQEVSNDSDSVIIIFVGTKPPYE